MQPSENPTAASLFSPCLLSSRGCGHCQWLGEAILAKVPRDPDGGEVQFMPYRKWHFCLAWDLLAPCCPLGTWRLGQGVGERDIGGPHSLPKFTGTLNLNKLDLFILHVMSLWSPNVVHWFRSLLKAQLKEILAENSRLGHLKGWLICIYDKDSQHKLNKNEPNNGLLRATVLAVGNLTVAFILLHKKQNNNKKNTDLGVRRHGSTSCLPLTYRVIWNKSLASLDRSIISQASKFAATLDVPKSYLTLTLLGSMTATIHFQIIQHRLFFMHFKFLDLQQQFIPSLTPKCLFGTSHCSSY